MIFPDEYLASFLRKISRKTKGLLHPTDLPGNNVPAGIPDRRFVRVGENPGSRIRSGGKRALRR